MDGVLKEFLQSGRALLTDTKTPKTQSVKAPKKGLETPVESDAHKVLIRRCIDEKISKKDVVEELKKFIKSAEDAL